MTHKNVKHIFTTFSAALCLHDDHNFTIYVALHKKQVFSKKKFLEKRLGFACEFRYNQISMRVT